MLSSLNVELHIQITMTLPKLVLYLPLLNVTRYTRSILKPVPWDGRRLNLDFGYAPQEYECSSVNAFVRFTTAYCVVLRSSPGGGDSRHAIDVTPTQKNKSPSIVAAALVILDPSQEHNRSRKTLK